MGKSSIEPIGIVHNNATILNFPGEIKSMESVIEVYPQYIEGLYGVECHKYILIVFGLHLNDEIKLKEPLRSGGEIGIFACRSQNRPNHLGVTNCILTKIKENYLYVKGLDAADSSPVYDIKPTDTSEKDFMDIDNLLLHNNPRWDIDYNIRNNVCSNLLIRTAALTGEITPQLERGVRIGVDFVQFIRKNKLEISDYVIKVKCFSHITDAVSYVTGIPYSSNRILCDESFLYGDILFESKTNIFNNLIFSY